MGTDIQWTAWLNRFGEVMKGETFNLWSGCTRVSRACLHCYAENALPSMRRYAEWGPSAPRKHASEIYWLKPLGWNRLATAQGGRMRVFVNSMSDLFEQHKIPEEQAKLEAARERFWKLMFATPQIDYLLLTKRVKEMADWAETHPWPENALAGASAEGQLEYQQRIEHLLRVPARRFLSVEPMVGRMQFATGGAPWLNLGHDGPGIHWVIVGGESGPEAEELDLGAAQALADQVQAARVPLFVKQLGSVWAQKYGARTPKGTLIHKKGGLIEEWPKPLQVRQFYKPDPVIIPQPVVVEAQPSRQLTLGLR